jgi:hypothetical protein
MPLTSLASEMPENIRKKFISNCEKYQSQQPPLFMEEGLL